MLRRVRVANLLTHTHETAVALAQRCGAHRATVADHASILEAALIGTRQHGGAFDAVFDAVFDAAFARIDTPLRETGMVVEEETGTAGATASQIAASAA